MAAQNSAAAADLLNAVGLARPVLAAASRAAIAAAAERPSKPGGSDPIIDLSSRDSNLLSLFHLQQTALTQINTLPTLCNHRALHVVAIQGIDRLWSREESVD